MVSLQTTSWSPIFKSTFKDSKLWRRNHVRSFANLGGGGNSHIKQDGAARRKFWKEPLRNTRLLFRGRGLNFFHP